MNLIKQPVMQLVLSSVIFGLGATFVVFIDLSATIIAFYRLFIGVFLFGGVLLFFRQSFRIAVKPLCFAALAGIFLGVDLSLWNTSILTIGPGIATILNSLQVFFMAAFGMLLYKEKANNGFLISLLVTFVGVVLLSHHEIVGQQAGLYGVTVGVLSGGAFAASMLCLRIAVQHAKDGLVKVMFYGSIGGALTTGIWGVLANERFMTATADGFMMMIAYAVFVHVIAWFLMAKSMPHVSVALVGLIFCLEPVVAFVVDVTFLAKAMTVLQFVGAVLTLLAIYLGSQFSKKKHEQ